MVLIIFIIATIKTAETLRELGYIVYGEPNVCTIGFCHR